MYIYIFTSKEDWRRVSTSRVYRLEQSVADQLPMGFHQASARIDHTRTHGRTHARQLSAWRGCSPRRELFATHRTYLKPAPLDEASASLRRLSVFLTLHTAHTAHGTPFDTLSTPSARAVHAITRQRERVRTSR